MTRRSLRRALRGFAPGAADADLWKDRRRAYIGSFFLVRAFYVALLFCQVECAPSVMDWLRLREIVPLWPVWWFRWTGIPAGVITVTGLSFAGTLYAAAVPTRRFPRCLAAVGILEFTAFFNSFGMVNHGWHGWVWIATLLILLPDGGIDRISSTTSCQQRYLRVVWAGQVALLGFYSLGGLFKLTAALVQGVNGEIGAFHPEGFPRILVNNLLQSNFQEPGGVIAPFLIERPWIAWPLHLMAIYLEAGSVLVAFRPSLQRAWGLMLILCHVVIYFTMNIMFSWHILLVGLWVVCSPWAYEVSVRRTLLALPFFGDLAGAAVRFARRARQA